MERKVRLLITGVALLIIGIALLATTLYVVEVAPPDMEDIHDSVPYAEYEWRTVNRDATMAGVAFTCIGILSIIASLMMRGKSQSQT